MVDERHEVQTDPRRFEGRCSSIGGFAARPHLQNKPSIAAATERAPKQPELLVGELDLHAAVDLPERRLVGLRCKAEGHDLDHPPTLPPNRARCRSRGDAGRAIRSTAPVLQTYGSVMEPWWNVPMREVFGGRRVVLAGGHAATWTEHIELLRDAGATDFLVVATEGRGAGPVPDVPTVIVEPPEDLSMMERIRFGDQTLAEPPDPVLTAVRAFDPDRAALVLGVFLNTSVELDGRPFLSPRRPEWVALEDKVVVDAFWDRAGVDRQPMLVAALAEADAAARELDRGDGTVWAADAREGFHGGASQTYWVRDEAGRERAIAGLRAACDRVRVMPFIEGTPCSIHGIVLPDGVVVLRPVEMLVLRRGTDFVYAGCATYWDPSDAVRAQMRDIARRAGAQLAAEVGFRGTFTVDGVVGADGFWPTELNPRFGAGIMTIARASGLPILLINDLVVGGHGLGRSAAAIERELVEQADALRGGGTWMGGVMPEFDADSRPIGRDADGSWDWNSTDTPAGYVTAGAGFVRCRYEPAATPIGPSTGSRAAAFWDSLDHEFGAVIGPLVPAPEPANESSAR